MDQVKAAERVRHYSLSTERLYSYWIREFIYFHDKKHPEQLGDGAIEHFLTYLAVEQKVSASTQNQALCALVFMYKPVLKREVCLEGGFELAKRPRRLPTVLSKTEIRALLSNMHGTNKLLATLIYGSGMRKMEALRLRVCDVNRERKESLVRNAKCSKDRISDPGKLRASFGRHDRSIERLF